MKSRLASFFRPSHLVSCYEWLIRCCGCARMRISKSAFLFSGKSPSISVRLAHFPYNWQSIFSHYLILHCCFGFNLIDVCLALRGTAFGEVFFSCKAVISSSWSQETVPTCREWWVGFITQQNVGVLIFIAFMKINRPQDLNITTSITPPWIFY